MPTAGIAQAGWNSLEIAKLLVQVTPPLTVAFIGYWLNHRLKSLEAAQWSQQKIIERRIEAYDRLTPDLNRLYCFFAYVGTWKEITPPQAIALKRSLDQVAYIQAPLFDASFLKKYNEFMDGCFATYQGWGRTRSYERAAQLAF
ncbi:hypothetical protein [Saccharopolyspora gloriosae]|uniref:hypothetical protein n=1 Tax=Saccharopolyspora gloriosae TaxID=455344 RepID=UPI001FB5842D|nr:hypothetical protein [Saccharopolyspora gloriosae]